MNRGERRKKNIAKALRKQKLANQLYSNSTWGDLASPWYDNLHQYSKNKIHCSCPYCTTKTKNKGKRRHIAKNYAPSYNPPIRDLRQMERMDYED